MNTKKFVIAQRMEDTTPLPAQVFSFELSIPDDNDGKTRRIMFYEEAERLEEALHAILPGGVYDFLLAHIACRMSSELTISHKDQK